jgi:hypothetical protein
MALMAKGTFSLRLSGDLRRRLFDAAEADRRSVGDWVRLLIERELGAREAIDSERLKMVGGMTE